MNQTDLDFFQGIVNQIIRYLTRADIEREKEEIQAIRQRALFKTVFVRQENFKQGEQICQAVEDYFDGFNHRPTPVQVDLQLNSQNLHFWTNKEMKEMPYLKDLKYRKLQSGIHQFRYRRDGFNVSFNSKNFETAKEKARKWLVDLKKKMGADISVKHVNSLDYVAKLWFDNKKAHVHAQTLNGYKSVYLNHIKPKFGHRKVSAILPLELQPFFNELFETRGKTCENAKIILNGIFDFAVANRFCQTNPIKGVIVEKHYRKTGATLTDDQIKRFKEKMFTLGGWGTAYLIILYSGIRGAELEKMSFNWTYGTFTVYNAKLKKGQRARTENLTRTVPIFPGLYQIRERIEKEDWRFPARNVSNYLSKHWSETSVKDLRHTFASKAREARIDNELVNLWTGHLPGKNVTANVYTHFSMDFQKQEAKKVPVY